MNEQINLQLVIEGDDIDLRYFGAFVGTFGPNIEELLNDELLQAGAEEHARFEIASLRKGSIVALFVLLGGFAAAFEGNRAALVTVIKRVRRALCVLAGWEEDESVSFPTRKEAEIVHRALDIVEKGGATSVHLYVHGDNTNFVFVDGNSVKAVAEATRRGLPPAPFIGFDDEVRRRIVIFREAGRMFAKVDGYELPVMNAAEIKTDKLKATFLAQGRVRFRDRRPVDVVIERVIKRNAGYQ